MTSAEFQTAVPERLDQNDKFKAGVFKRLDRIDQRLDSLETRMDESHKLLQILQLVG